MALKKLMGSIAFALTFNNARSVSRSNGDPLQRVVAEERVPRSPTDAYRGLFSDKAQMAMLQQNGFHDIQLNSSEWHSRGERFAEYTCTEPAPGMKKPRAKEVQSVVSFRPSYLGVETRTDTSNVPGADCFTVHVKYEIHALGQDNGFARISYELSWHKWHPLKWAIERGASLGVAKSAHIFLQFARREREPDFPTEPPGIGSAVALLIKGSA